MNIPGKLRSVSKEWPIAVILLVGFLMRTKGLTWQSLWLDELHTMNEADPAVSWGDMFNSLKCCDQHPPLHFIIEHISFIIFGHTEFVARIISVIVGTASIWAMYFLGKEVLNKRLGLFAAMMTCINFYNISYSQEARPYIFAFLFAALSFAWLIRLVKLPSRKNAVLYSVFTLLFLYSHYYSLFAVVAQGALALVFIFQEKGKERVILFRFFLLAGVIIAIGYIPWLSHLAAMSRIKSFWIQDIAPGFIQNFFYGYFGDAEILKPLLLVLLLVYVIRVAMEAENSNRIKSSPLLLSFTTSIFWVFITLLIPYLRSLLTVPMLFPRYTIVILPAIILSLAYGIELVRHAFVKYILLALFISLSLIHIFFVKKFYTEISKSQFREMTKYVISENSSSFPILNEVTYWHQGYYLKKFGSTAEILTGKKESVIDSILSARSPKYILEGFWIAGAHGDKKPDENALKNLDTAYRLVKQHDFYDAWAMLFISRKEADKKYAIIRYDQFHDGAPFPKEEFVAIWGGAIYSNRFSLPRGKYRITVRAWGDPGGGEFPHVNIYVNDIKAGDYFLTNRPEEKSFTCEINGDTAVVKIEMDNDFAEPGKGDRNVFVKNVLLEKM